MNKRYKRHQQGESVAELLMLMDGNDRARREIISLEAEVEALKARAALAGEVYEELRTREQLSRVDVLVYPRLTDYEEGWLARYDALTKANGT